MTILLSLIACFCWGISDFLGGVKSRQLPIIIVLFISIFFSVLILSAILLFKQEAFPNNPSLWWAAIAGIFGLSSMFFLYKALSIGTISIIAPITATGVIIPVIFGIIKGELISPDQIAGIVIAIMGTIILSSKKSPVDDDKSITSGIKYAFLAGICDGLFLLTFSQSGNASLLWSTLILRSTYCILLIPVLIIYHPVFKIRLSNYIILSTMGVIDTIAGFSFIMAASIGLLSIVSVISSLYPAVTVFLSTTVLKEKLNRTQWIGILLAFSGIVLISI